MSQFPVSFKEIAFARRFRKLFGNLRQKPKLWYVGSVDLFISELDLTEISNGMPN